MAKRTTQTTTTSTPAATLVTEQAAGAPTVEQPVAQTPAPAPTAAEVAQGVADTARELAPLLTAIGAKQAEEDARVAEVMEQADRALVACRKAYAKGDRAHCAGLLEAGRWASQYIALRLSVGAPRDNAVDAVQGELAKVAWDRVDANRLVAVFHTHRLLSDGYCQVAQVEEAPAVPYTHLRDGWRNLVQRVPGDDAEDYVLLPGLESECWTLYVTAVRDKLELPAVQARVKELQGLYAKQEQTRKAQEQARLAEAAKAKDEEAKAARAKALEEAKALKDQQRALEEAAAKAKQDASEETSRALEETAAALRAQQQATIRAQEEAAEAQREAARLKREQEELQKAQDRLAAKAAKAAEEAERKAKAAEEKARGKGKGQAPAKDQGKDQNAANHPGVSSVRELESRGRSGAAQGRGPSRDQDDVLAGLTKATAKDAADVLLQVVACHEEPDTLVEELVKRLAQCTELSSPVRRAMKAALTLLHRPEQPQAPVHTPEELAAKQQQLRVQQGEHTPAPKPEAPAPETVTPVAQQPAQAPLGHAVVTPTTGTLEERMASLQEQFQAASNRAYVHSKHGDQEAARAAEATAMEASRQWHVLNAQLQGQEAAQEQPQAQDEAQDTPEDAGQELARAIADATPQAQKQPQEQPRLSKAERKAARRAARQAQTSSPSPVDIAQHLAPQVNGTPAHAGK